ncbi:hypothetical protein QR680_006608 [Steinernema hermaphroditum]|uniref:Uncharacterized protein n=1 Tax=Steinernema hermaphroditum TaxID=289476 RepID=A0AA39HXF7_9BILA|nr:hypothetical protein QR680_006608 [Steinernema hermaphroditum]
MGRRKLAVDDSPLKKRGRPASSRESREEPLRDDFLNLSRNSADPRTYFQDLPSSRETAASAASHPGGHSIPVRRVRRAFVRASAKTPSIGPEDGSIASACVLANSTLENLFDGVPKEEKDELNDETYKEHDIQQSLSDSPSKLSNKIHGSRKRQDKAAVIAPQQLEDFSGANDVSPTNSIEKQPSRPIRTARTKTVGNAAKKPARPVRAARAKVVRNASSCVPAPGLSNFPADISAGSTEVLANSPSGNNPVNNFTGRDMVQVTLPVSVFSIMVDQQQRRAPDMADALGNVVSTMVRSIPIAERPRIIERILDYCAREESNHHH